MANDHERVMESEDDRHSGLAHERTELAWNRTGLAVVVAVTIMLRRLWPLQGYKTVVTLVLISLGAITWAVSVRLARRVRIGPDSVSGLAVTTARLLSVGTVLLASAAFLLGLLSPA
jgi:uncharacterized membrane protein YidH (DUF202 family)